MHTLQIRDETATGEILNKLLLEFESEHITVQELIEARIRIEVERYEKGIKTYRHGLVAPTNLEKRLNQTNQSKKTKIDIEKQVYIALDAFQKNGFFILVNDEQVETLDQKVWVNADAEVSFIKLTQLVGG